MRNLNSNTNLNPNSNSLSLLFNNCRPFSINSAYYKATWTRTRECREWGSKIIRELHKVRNLRQLNDNRRWVQESLALKVSITYAIPIKDFVTSDGEVSIRTCDLSNVEKLLIDLIFDEKHSPYNLKKNDKIIIELDSKKLPTWGEAYIIFKVSDMTLPFLILRDMKAEII